MTSPRRRPRRRPLAWVRLEPTSAEVDAWLDEQPQLRGMLTPTLARAILALGFRAGWRRGVARARGEVYPDGRSTSAEQGEGPRS